MFTQQRDRGVLRRGFQVLDALAAPHGADRFVEMVAPTWSTTEVRGRVVDVDRQATGSVLLTIEANRGWTGFLPGQHTQLSVEIDGVRRTRSYSMCSSADGGRRFQLGIKAHPEGLVSRHLVAHAKPGLVVGLTPASGEFHLPHRRPERILLISGGSGITPVLSMLRTLVGEHHTGPITFMHYSKDPASMLCAEDVRAIGAAHPNVTLVLGFDDEPASGDLVGLFTPDHLDAADPDWRNAEAFVCGPAPLMDAVRACFDDAGIGEHFHQEAFTPPQIVIDPSEVSGVVGFTRSGIEVDNDGRSLLDQAEDAGTNPTSGCRMGICHTCVRPLRRGTVRNTLTDAITTDADTEIQLCVNVALGDVDVDL